MTVTGRHTGTSDRSAPSRRRPGGNGAGWLIAVILALVLGVLSLAIGAWALSRPDASVSPWGPAGGTLLGPILMAIAIGELLRRRRRARARPGRHTGRG